MVRKLRSVRVAVAALRVGKGILRHLLVQKALLLNSVLVCLDLLFFLLDFQLNSLLFDLVLQVLIELISLLQLLNQSLIQLLGLLHLPFVSLHLLNDCLNLDLGSF